MSDVRSSGAAQGKKKVIKIQYEDLAAKYAAQFTVDRTDELYLLGFSTGIIEDTSTGACLLPVHSRIAVSEAGVRKLVTVLQDALSQKGAVEKAGARVPRVDDTV